MLLWLFLLYYSTNKHPSYRLVVRTLDFHSNNAGSNPASSNISRQLLINNVHKHKAVFRYDFFFVSLLPLLRSKVGKTYYNRLEHKLGKKIFVKKSYLILLWLNYLTVSKNTRYTVKTTAIQPNTKLYTVVKAPMAHKTNSKEQFMFKYFYFRVQFQAQETFDLTTSYKLRRINCLINLFPVFETNMLFLQFYKVSLPMLSKTFFNL